MPFYESFFATSAQVLAALLIAYIIEIGSIIKLAVRRIEVRGFDADTTLPATIAASPDRKRELTYWELISTDGGIKKVLIGIGIVASLFVVGEVLSLGALSQPHSGEHVGAGGVVTLASVFLIDIVTLLVIVILPIFRLWMETGDILLGPVKWRDVDGPPEPHLEGGGEGDA